VKKSEEPRFYGQNKLFFENPALQPLGSFSHMAACRSSLENTWKMSLILVFNKNSSRAHTESELGMLGVHRKLVKYVVHSSKRKKLKKNYFSSHKLPKQQSTSFWSQGILGVKLHHFLIFLSLISSWKGHFSKVREVLDGIPWSYTCSVLQLSELIQTPRNGGLDV
jgi:hypothetical protein